MVNFRFSSAAFSALMVLLVLLSATAKGDNYIPPGLSPYLDNICDDVKCGRGNCSVQLGKPFNFVCECEAGWRRTRFDSEQDLEFLPCIIPNCSLDYSCMPAAPPTPPVPYNLSFFDPCYWMYCGEGTCSKNSTYTHTCQCSSGYKNLLDTPQFPCYPDCAIGADCARLGIQVTRSTASPSGGGNSQGQNGSGSNQASSILPGTFHWVAILLMSLALAIRN